MMKDISVIFFTLPPHVTWGKEIHLKLTSHSI